MQVCVYIPTCRASSKAGKDGKERRTLVLSVLLCVLCVSACVNLCMCVCHTSALECFFLLGQSCPWLDLRQGPAATSPLSQDHQIQPCLPQLILFMLTNYKYLNENVHILLNQQSNIINNINICIESANFFFVLLFNEVLCV